MVGIANILALSKLSSQTPDDVRTAATLMIVGGNKNPLLSGIASANMVESATTSAVEADTAKKAKTVAEKRVVDLEAEIAVIRPLVAAVADRSLGTVKTVTTDGTPVDGYTRMIAALKSDETVESILDKLKKAPSKNT